MLRANLELEVLPFRLVIGTVKKKNLAKCTHSLIRNALFPHVNVGLDQSACNGDNLPASPLRISTPDRQFLSISHTAHEISLIIPHDAIDLYPDDLLEVCPTKWRALQIYPGEFGAADLAKTINVVADTLASGNVSIFQVSTFFADYTLVKEKDLEVSLQLLDTLFTVLNRQDVRISASPVQRRIHSKATLPVEIAMTKLDLNGDETPLSSSLASTTASAKHLVTFPSPKPYLIASLRDPLMFDSLLRFIIRVVFYHAHDLFSMTIVDGVPSFIMDQATIDIFPPEVFNILESDCSQQSTGGDQSDWMVVEIGANGLGFDEAGIVANYTAPLARADINCFYLSTYHCDFVLVCQGAFSEAKSLLLNR